MWGEPAVVPYQAYPIFISTHSPRVGRTQEQREQGCICANFNSLAPCGANRDQIRTDGRVKKFQLTRPVWGEPDGVREDASRYEHFNSLAPCGANPGIPCQPYSFAGNFNSLAPCGANQYGTKDGKCAPKFQLTRPVWGEPDDLTEQAAIANISTHSPRVGRTQRHRQWCADRWEFQLTRPVWGEPVVSLLHKRILYISTHSPRVGRTSGVRPERIRPRNFNSLAPCGANPYMRILNRHPSHFNSLAPCGANRCVVDCRD